MKYTTKFTSLSDAKSATLYSPALTLITEGNSEALLVYVTDTDDEELVVKGDTIANAYIQKKK